MNGTITIKQVERKTTKSGEPYLRVQSDKNKWYSVWEQALFGMMKEGVTLQVSVITKGDFTNITDVIDPDGTPHVTAEATPRNLILEAALRIEKKVDAILAHIPDALGADEAKIPLD